MFPHLREGHHGIPDGVIREKTAADQGEQETDEAGKPAWAAGVQLFPEHGAVAQGRTSPEPPPASAASIDRSPAAPANPPSSSWRRKIGRNCKAASGCQDQTQTQLQPDHPGKELRRPTTSYGPRPERVQPTSRQFPRGCWRRPSRRATSSRHRTTGQFGIDTVLKTSRERTAREPSRP